MLKISHLFKVVACLVASNLAFAANENLIPLNAKFETTSCDLPCNSATKQAKTQWWLLRNHQQVEKRKDGSNNSQLWLKSTDNQLNYFYVLHDEKRAIEYAALDLNILGITTDQKKWQTLTSLIAKDDLVKLTKKQAKQKYEAYSLEQYSGLLNGVQTEVLWIAELQIPLQISYLYPTQKITVDLIKRYVEKMPIALTTQQTLVSYQQVDYADIGDIEHSVVSGKWLGKAEDAPGIHAH
jgi:hypothetical protein